MTASEPLESVYFGCWGAKGHFFWRPNGTRLSHYDQVASRLPWPKIDGWLTPAPGGEQGDAALHHAGDWTALAWHDYSVDRRPGSNSVLFHPGTLTFEFMLQHLAFLWTPIYARQPNVITLAPLSDRDAS